MVKIKKTLFTMMYSSLFIVIKIMNTVMLILRVN